MEILTLPLTPTGNELYHPFVTNVYFLKSLGEFLKNYFPSKYQNMYVYVHHWLRVR